MLENRDSSERGHGTWNTLVELLRDRSARKSNQRGFTFLNDGEKDEIHCSYKELDQHARAIAATLQQEDVVGERALLLFPPGLDFVASFFGSLYAGVVAVPAYPPDPVRLQRTLPRLEAIVEDAGAKFVLTTSPVLAMASVLFEQAPKLKDLKWIATDALPSGVEEQWHDFQVDTEDLAFLQYTSGSTGSPKGVMLSHANLLANCSYIYQAFGHSDSSKGVIWLPPYHDMGLIGGILQPVYGGFPVVLMSPIAFLQRPLRWLEAITRYGATTSGGPNFAYDLCIRKITPEVLETLDLKTWDLAFNGAEPVRHGTLDRFSKVFEPAGFRRQAFYSCYGLAEATLLVTGGKKSALPAVRSFQGPALEHNLVAPPRSLVEIEATYFGPCAPRTDLTKDLSTSGTFVRTEEPLQSGTVISLRFSQGLQEKPIEIQGEVARVVPNDRPDCGMGVRFIFGNPEQKERFESWVGRVTKGRPASGGKGAKTLVGAGQPMPGTDIVIAQPASMTRCWKDQVGEIWIQGPCVASGYWNRPEETSGTFEARLLDTGEGPFMRSGDLGFFREGELFIAGRLKDLIVIRGANHHPQDIETTVEHAHPNFLRPGCGAAFSVEMEGDERLVVVQELDRRFQADRRAKNATVGDAKQTEKQDRRSGSDRRADRADIQAFAPPEEAKTKPDMDEIIASIRQAVSERHELQVYAVVLIKAGSIPKTSSGKVQRYACRTGFLSGTLDAVAKWQSSEIEVAVQTPIPEIDASSREGVRAWLLSVVSSTLGVPVGDLRSEEPLVRYGIDSLQAVNLQNDVEHNLDVVLPVTLFLRESINGLVKEIKLAQKDVIPAEVSGDQRRYAQKDRVPASYRQHDFWSMRQWMPDSVTQHLVWIAKVQGKVEQKALRDALRLLVERHECLRTTLSRDDQGLWQLISKTSKVQLDVAQQTDLDSDDFHKMLLAESKRPFDLQLGPLFRAKWFMNTEQEHVLLVVGHHAVVDAWAMALLIREFRVAYRACARSDRISFPLPQVSYSDYVQWQEEMIAGPEGDRHEAYWKRVLSGATHQIDIPTDFPRPAKPSLRTGVERFSVDRDTTQKLKNFAAEQGCTHFVVLFAGFVVLLYRYCLQDDFLLGVSTSCRTRAAWSSLVGAFAQAIPLRVQLEKIQTVSDLVRVVREGILSVMEHQDYPIELITKAGDVHRTSLHSSVPFRVLFNFIEESKGVQGLAPFMMGIGGHQMPFNGSMLESISIKMPLMDQFDLTLVAAEIDDSFAFSLNYDQDIYDAQSARTMANHLGAIFSSMVEHDADNFLFGDLLNRITGRKSQIVISATFTAEPVQDSLNYWTKKLNMPAQISFAPYNQVFQQLLDSKSAFASNLGGFNILLIRFEDWIQFDKNETNEQTGMFVNRIEKDVVELINSLKRSLNERVAHILFICPPSPKFVKSNLLNSALHQAEHVVSESLQGLPGIFVVPWEELNSVYPVTNYYDKNREKLGRIPYSPRFFTALGTMIARKIAVYKRKPFKVIVLDCDNTLWGGVVAEDGVDNILLDDAYLGLQRFMVDQHDAGMVLCVCSKNTEQDVMEAFEKRDDMVLKKQHLVAWKINWLSKAENIKQLAQQLGLGLDSFIFVDDNPVERAEVKAMCPDVLVLDLPEQAEKYPQFLRHVWEFDRLRVTEDDRKRVVSYKQNVEREKYREATTSLKDFLRGLELEISISAMQAEDIPRVSQLTLRTNQFNCSCIRRTEADIEALCNGRLECFTVRVKDRFGDYGLIGVFMVDFQKNGSPSEYLWVDTFLLSCRALGRGVEQRMFSKIVQMAELRGKMGICVSFVSTDRNRPAKEFLRGLGGSFEDRADAPRVVRFEQDSLKQQLGKFLDQVCGKPSARNQLSQTEERTNG